MSENNTQDQPTDSDTKAVEFNELLAEKDPRNNSENRRVIFDKLYLMITGGKAKTHYYSKTIEFIRNLS